MIAMYSGDIKPLLNWTKQKTEKLPKEYFSWLFDHMPENCRTRFSHHVGIIKSTTPLTEDGWVVGYPHVHQKTMGWKPEVYTIITYLTKPTGGEFAMGGFNRNDPYNLINVEIGLSVGCDSMTWHGVKPVRRGLRIAIVSAGFPC